VQDGPQGRSGGDNTAPPKPGPSCVSTVGMPLLRLANPATAARRA
jgi:hypothetical protein